MEQVAWPRGSNAYLRLLSTKIQVNSADDGFDIFELTCYLLEEGLDASATDTLGFNVLILFTYAYVMQPSTIRMLHTSIKYGTYLNQKNSEGRNIFSIIYSSQEYPANYLLELARVPSVESSMLAAPIATAKAT